MVPPQGSAEASYSHPTTAQASFLTVTLPAEARSWGGASSSWESGRSGGSALPFPLVKLPCAQFPYWSLKAIPVSLLTCSSVLQIKRLSLTYYSPIISLKPMVLPLLHLLHLPQIMPVISSRSPQVLSSPGSHPLSSPSTECPVQSWRNPPYLLPPAPFGSLHGRSPWPCSKFVHLDTLHMLFPTPVLGSSSSSRSSLNCYLPREALHDQLA